MHMGDIPEVLVMHYVRAVHMLQNAFVPDSNVPLARYTAEERVPLHKQILCPVSQPQKIYCESMQVRTLSGFCNLTKPACMHRRYAVRKYLRRERN